MFFKQARCPYPAIDGTSSTPVDKGGIKGASAQVAPFLYLLLQVLTPTTFDSIAQMNMLCDSVIIAA